MFDALTSQLRDAPSLSVEKAIKTLNIQAEISAKFGYGLTLRLADQEYIFHLPDAATNSRQAAMLRNEAFPYEDILLRLRRRVHPDVVILDTCCDFGARAVFYAKSIHAKRVYALGTESNSLALAEKNALLNDLADVVRTYRLNVTEEKLKGAVTNLDRFCKDQKINQVDLLSLSTRSLKAVTDGGMEETLAKCGPAVIFWGQGSSKEERETLKRTLAAHGYAEPEGWTTEVLFWVSRI